MDESLLRSVKSLNEYLQCNSDVKEQIHESTLIDGNYEEIIAIDDESNCVDYEMINIGRKSSLLDESNLVDCFQNYLINDDINTKVTDDRLKILVDFICTDLIEWLNQLLINGKTKLNLNRIQNVNFESHPEDCHVQASKTSPIGIANSTKSEIHCNNTNPCISSQNPHSPSSKNLSSSSSSKTELADLLKISTKMLQSRERTIAPESNELILSLTGLDDQKCLHRKSAIYSNSCTQNVTPRSVTVNCLNYFNNILPAIPITPLNRNSMRTNETQLDSSHGRKTNVGVMGVTGDLHQMGRLTRTESQIHGHLATSQCPSPNSQCKTPNVSSTRPQCNTNCQATLLLQAKPRMDTLNLTELSPTNSFEHVNALNCTTTSFLSGETEYSMMRNRLLPPVIVPELGKLNAITTCFKNNFPSKCFSSQSNSKVSYLSSKLDCNGQEHFQRGHDIDGNMMKNNNNLCNITSPNSYNPSLRVMKLLPHSYPDHSKHVIFPRLENLSEDCQALQKSRQLYSSRLSKVRKHVNYEPPES